MNRPAKARERFIMEPESQDAIGISQKQFERLLNRIQENLLPPSPISPQTEPSFLAYLDKNLDRIYQSIKESNALNSQHINELREEMNKRFEQVEKRFEQVDKRFEELREDTNKRFEELREDMNKRFEELREDMNKRFEQVDKRFEQVDKRFEQVDKRFEQVEKRFEQVDKRFEQVEKRFEQVDKRFEQIFWFFGTGLTIISILIALMALFR